MSAGSHTWRLRAFAAGLRRVGQRLHRWPADLLRDVLHTSHRGWIAFCNRTPLAQLRVATTVLLLLLGAVLVTILVMPNYDRALVLSGRTELLAMRLDDPGFGHLQLGPATWFDPDTGSRQGMLDLDLPSGATATFVRVGHGPLRLTFETGANALQGSCRIGQHQVGVGTLDGTDAALCDTDAVVLPMASGSDPLVVGLSGDLTVGKEVSEGAGAQPILLEATAALLVRHHSALFRWACGYELLESLCDRFVANSVALSPGSSVGAVAAPKQAQAAAGLGFLRVDPSEVGSGMSFFLSAPAVAFVVRRMEGEAFTVRESVFDVVERSPMVHALNAALAALGLVWYFLRLGRKGGDGEGAAAAVAALLALGAPGFAYAQQAFVRADGTGQALLRARGERCYAVTLAHVMGDETSALLTAPGRERGEADVLRRIPAAPEPVVLLGVRGLPPSVCPAFEGAASLDDLLRAHSTATLRLVRADGSLDLIPLSLGSVETETLEVRADAVPLEQGMSGGTVLVADQPVGLLTDVQEGGRIGRVARMDRVFERLTPHLASALPVQAPHAATGSVAYEIVRSTAEPVSPANKVTSLQGDGPGPWRVAAQGRVELVLKLAAPVAGVSLDVTGLDDPPSFVEVLGGRTEHGPWQSLATFSLERGDRTQERLFPPARLPFMLLRAAASSGQQTSAVGSLSFLPR